MSNEEVLKLKDVAALLKVGAKTVYSMAQTGELLSIGMKIPPFWGIEISPPPR
jgi:predicted DNA-binding transcriptional regulator AlpA